MKNDIVDIPGELVSPFETEKAYRFFDGDRTVWLPKSICEWDAHEKSMMMPEWLAEEKDLI